MNLLDFALVSRWMAPHNQGGVAMHHGYLAKVLKIHTSLTLISVQNTENQKFYQTERIKFIGLSIRSYWFSRFLNKSTIGKNFNRHLHDDQVSQGFAMALASFKVGVVEFMDIHSEAYRYLKKRDTKEVKVHIRSHTPWTLLRETYTEEERKGIDAFFAREREHYCFHAADIISTPSEDLKKQLIRLFALPADKIVVIPNLLDTEHFKPLERREKWEGFTFLHVGRFERAKGVLTMTKAFIELAKEYPHIRLINVGKPRGAAFDTCQKWINEAGLANRVTFTGFVPYEELPQWYAEADAVVVPPEIYESFSYTVAQAMACGKWVIASDSGGMPETLHHGQFGSIFEKGNTQSLKTKMIEAIKRPLQLEVAARTYAQTKFGLDQNGQNWLKFYHVLSTANK